MAQVLFGDDSSGSEAEFKVSNKYADNYNNWREKEEFQRLQAKYGKDVALDNGNAVDETSSSSEDDDAEEITPQVEKQFFEALSKLKQNDPEIYDPGRRFFNETQEDHATGSKKKRKDKPMFLRDYEREMLLKTGEVQDEGGAGPSGVGAEKTYMEEQEEIKAEFRSLLNDSDDEEAEGFTSSILKKREKSAADKEHEDEQYKIWLKGQQQSVSDKAVEGRLKGLKEAWSNPKISKDEAFLRDYILSKRYLEEGDDSYVPSYDEVVHDSEGDLSEDERTVGQQEEFEHKFNFRFEEPDQDFIKRYPRTIKNSLRKKDERRKQSREEKKMRQEEEKRRKEEELKRLKTLKRKEIMEKLETLKEVVGNADLPFEANDLDADFDPEAHDKKMQEMFGDDYYYDAENDEEKPVFSDDEENWDTWMPDAGGEEGEDEEEEQLQQPSQTDADAPACEQPGFVMDCDYDPAAAAAAAARRPPEELNTGRGRKKRRGKLAELLRRRKPRFDPAGAQPLAEYVDQYYKLDEMMNPHPFKYREVVANDFGLDAQEILMADERDLNRWVSVKRMSQYVRPEEEHHDIKKYKAKSSNAFYKQKVLQSLYTKPGEPEDDPESYEPQKKKKKKRKKKEKEMPEDSYNDQQEQPDQDEVAVANGATSVDFGGVAEDAVEDPETQPESKKKKKKRKKERETAEELVAGGDEVVPSTNGHGSAHDEPPAEGKKKKKKKRKSSEEVQAADEAPEITETVTTQERDPDRKTKKKKKKRKHEDEDAVDSAAPAAAADAETPARKKHRHSATDTSENAPSPSKKKRVGEGQRPQKPGGRRRRGPPPEQGTQAAMVLSMSDARLEAFGLNPKKIRGKMIYGKNAS